MLRNTNQSFGWVSKTLHWVVGLMVLTLLGVGLYMTDMEPSPEKWEMYGIHKATGLLVLAFVVLRLYWRATNTVPGPNTNIPHWQNLIADINVYILYALMVLMPSAGILMSYFGNHPIDFYGLFTIPASGEENKELAGFFKESHEFMGSCLLFFISIHLGAALYHHYYIKDSILRRMLPW